MGSGGKNPQKLRTANLKNKPHLSLSAEIFKRQKLKRAVLVGREMWRIAKCGVEIFEREMWLRYPRYGKIQHIRMSHTSNMLNFRSAFSINSQFTRSSVTFLLKRSMSQPSDGNSNENKKPKKSFTEIVKENLISLEPDEYTPEPLDSAKMITPAVGYPQLSFSPQ